MLGIRRWFLAEVGVKFDIDDEMYEEVLEVLKDIFAGEEIFIVET